MYWVLKIEIICHAALKKLYLNLNVKNRLEYFFYNAECKNTASHYLIKCNIINEFVVGTSL